MTRLGRDEAPSVKPSSGVEILQSVRKDVLLGATYVPHILHRDDGFIGRCGGVVAGVE